MNATAARFSIPAVVAARLMQGRIRPDSFSSDLLTSAHFLHLVSIVDLMPGDSDVAASRHCRVEVMRSDGTILAGQADHCPGDPLEPLPPETLREKFLSLTQPSGRFSGEELWCGICQSAAESDPRSASMCGCPRKRKSVF
jgi:2-methylcitrate dehydratase PrpD